MYEENTKEMMENISQNANSQTINSEELKELMKKEHRFLQNQIFFSVIIPMIEALAESGYDRRNEQSVKQARKMLEKLE